MPVTNPAGGPRAGNRAWKLVPAALMATFVLVATANGQAPSEAPTPDTEFTPVAKEVPEEGGEWVQIGGVDFGDDSVKPDSATPATVDFFDTAFAPDAPDAYGLFVGAECTDPDPAISFEALATCQRLPAIYQHQVAPGQPGEIREVLGPQASVESEPGYIAAATWIDANHAIAVGGTGHYPRRELPRNPGETDAEYAARDLAGEEANAAGRARAWLLQRDGAGQLHIDEVEAIPADADGNPAAGLTTVDCSPRTSVDGNLCIAGGMRQLWIIKDGRFTESFTPNSKDAAGDPTVEDGSDWRFRIRSVAFSTGISVDSGTPSAIAVTSGCCGPNELDNTARVLVYDGKRWYAQFLAYTKVGAPFVGGALQAADDTQRPPRARQSLPESYYSASFAGEGSSSATAIATPGGAAPAEDDPVGEDAARLIQFTPRLPDQDPQVSPSVTTATSTASSCGRGVGPLGNLCGQLANPNLSDLRLVAGDGDFDRSSDSNVISSGDGAARPDDLMDWAVGSLAAGGAHHDDRGAAYTTLRRGNFTPNPLECTVGTQTSIDDCNARETGEITGETESQSLYALPTYALNAFAFTPGGAVGWAAGDKGAIMRLGGEGTVASQTLEPAPPNLGAARTEQLPDTARYDEARPGPASDVAELPAVGDQPVERLAEPELVAAGTPSPRIPSGGAADSVRTIVMSRDGSEGWALGGTARRGAQGTIFHYTGGRWRRCESIGITGQTEPDPACRELGVLSGDSSAQITSAARVPLERDSDPTNDDEFEVVAIGSKYKSSADGILRRLVARYRNGEWTIDSGAMEVIDPNGPPSIRSPDFAAVEFTAPDDGWILAAQSSAAGMELLRFDGKDWIDCGKNEGAREACGDPEGILPLGQPTNVGRFTLTAAGTRLYLAGTRTPQAADAGLPDAVQDATSYPMILSLETAAEAPRWVAELDNGCVTTTEDGQCIDSGEAADRGWISAFSVARGGPGGFFGWAAGLFGPVATRQLDDDAARSVGQGSEAALLRGTYIPDEQDPTDTVASWQTYSEGDAADDYLFDGSGPPTDLLSTIGHDGAPRSFLIPAASERASAHPMLSFAAPEGGAEPRWSVFETPFALRGLVDSRAWNTLGARVQAMAPDGNGGAWLAVRRGPTSGGRDVFFYRYTNQRPKPVFEDAPHPIREQITDTAATADGQFWVSTKSGVVYRYDRVLGWDRAEIPGWDPGRVVTRTSAANAIAFGPDGTGVVVGEGGRIAKVGPESVKLDRAAGAALCAPESPTPPCATGRALYSAAVGPDGSALLGGESRALLYRPAGGEFRAITKPLSAINAILTGITMPSPDEAWITTNTGQIFVGTRTGTDWSWRLENLNADRELVTLDAGRRGIPLNAIDLDASGHGYAVGEQGLLLERTPGAAHPWRRVHSGVREHLFSVALPEGAGTGALVGGEYGLVLTLRGGRVDVARTGEFTDPAIAGENGGFSGGVVGLALLPGYETGQVEAWAAVQAPRGIHRPAPGAMLHYTNAPEEPLLDAGERTGALADAAPPAPASLSFAAFGRTDGHLDSVQALEPHGTNFTNEVVPRAILADLESEADEAEFALFTGDVNRAAGRNEHDSTPLDVDLMHRRWAETVAAPFAEAGVQLFSALGVQDLSQVKSCPNSHCLSTADAGVGTPGPWEESFATQPGPWGDGEAPSATGISFEPVDEPTDDGQAQTHYAADIFRDGEEIARLIVIDNSLRSLSASDAQQNPIEVQALFLERMLCRDGSHTSTGEDCTRGADQETIVAMNTPPYAYETSASAGGVETATDQATIEALLLEGDADLVVAGRLGWNGLYYTLAPGLHCPGPGGEHPDPTKTPTEDSAAAGCEQGARDLLAQVQTAAQGQGGTTGIGGGSTPTGELPTVVASGAGGTFGPVNDPVDGSASRGFWHGYSLVHLDTESGRVRVEQRPVFDWISLTAKEHVVRPRQRLSLVGEGREVAGADTPLRYDAIDSHAITHRYDLLLADPEQPWLPCSESDPACLKLHANLSGGEPATENECAPYLCLPAAVGTVDRITGELRAGDGRYPETFAIAKVSVGEKSATWPLVFARSPSFVVRSALRTPGLPGAIQGGGAKPPPPPPIPDVPKVPEIEIPSVPVPPAIPTLTAASPPEPSPPAPPAPPPPSQQPAPLDLSVAPPGVSIATPTALIQPPTPPVNPAPPGGARREARQRQAAAQKGGAESESQDAQGEGGVDPTEASGRVNQIDSQVQPATRRSGSRMELPATRRDRVRPGASFDVLADRDQGSAWTTGALYGGSAALMALVMALGWSRIRPTPRRSEPELPAPAWGRWR